MKKKFTSFSICSVLSVASFAQITISQSDMPAVGVQVIQAHDTTTTTLSPGPSGASQTWNFAALLNNKQDITDFIAPSSTPYASTFPGANIAVRDLTSPPDTNYQYLNSSGSEFNVQGAKQTINGNRVTIKFTPAQKGITLPSTYNTAFKSAMAYDITFPYAMAPVDSVRAKHMEADTSHVDGWGMVTTPSGTYNSIRQKYITAQIDSVWIHISGTWNFYQANITNDTTYRWWANGKGSDVLEMKFNGGLQKGVVYLVSTTAGVNEINDFANTTSVFPNPAVDAVTISSTSDKASTVTIFDVNGNKISESRFSGKTATLNTAALSPGVYFFEVLDANSGKLSHGKFIIQ